MDVVFGFGVGLAFSFIVGTGIMSDSVGVIYI